MPLITQTEPHGHIHSIFDTKAWLPYRENLLGMGRTQHLLACSSLLGHLSPNLKWVCAAVVTLAMIIIMIHFWLVFNVIKKNSYHHYNMEYIILYMPYCTLQSYISLTLIGKPSFDFNLLTIFFYMLTVHSPLCMFSSAVNNILYQWPHCHVMVVTSSSSMQHRETIYDT